MEGTLLKPGDMIRIRDDIKEGVTYRMILNDCNSNSWIENEMAPAGTLVTITNITLDGQYQIDYDHNMYNFDFDPEFWCYTDEMFDPEFICLLFAERYDIECLNEL